MQGLLFILEDVKPIEIKFRSDFYILTKTMYKDIYIGENIIDNNFSIKKVFLHVKDDIFQLLTNIGFLC